MFKYLGLALNLVVVYWLAWLNEAVFRVGFVSLNRLDFLGTEVRDTLLYEVLVGVGGRKGSVLLWYLVVIGGIWLAWQFRANTAQLLVKLHEKV